VFIRFDRIHERDVHTHRQTDEHQSLTRFFREIIQGRFRHDMKKKLEFYSVFGASEMTYSVEWDVKPLPYDAYERPQPSDSRLQFLYLTLKS